MKRVISGLLSALVVVLLTTAFADAMSRSDDGNTSRSLPEPGTMAVLGGLVAGGVIARKILKRK